MGALLVERALGVNPKHKGAHEYLGEHYLRMGDLPKAEGQLKILQEVITLSVFVPFAVLYMKEPLKLDYLWAGLCLLGAVYFMFRGELVPR